MLQPNQHQQQVFRSLAQSGEGEALYTYIMQLRDQCTHDIIDAEDTTPEKIAGAKIARAALKELADRLINTSASQPEPDRFD